MKKMKFNTEKYKVYTWKNWMMLFWILNPGSVINELIFGQRIPKISLEDKTSDKPRFERTVVPCPHCNTLHDGRMWSEEKGTHLKNWFGLYCKNCENIIPCLTSWLSFLIQMITFPLWIWFRESTKRKWLEMQPKRYENVDVKRVTNPFAKNLWVKSGLVFGAFMFLVVLFSTYLNGEEISPKTLLVGVEVCLIGGLVFGYTMKLFTNKRYS